MSVRRLKRGQKGRCSWCQEQATHRGFMFGKYACDAHLVELAEWDRRAQAPDYSDAAFIGGWR